MKKIALNLSLSAVGLLPMEAVNNQKEDVPYDSKDPLYKFGFGLSY